jgi:hypothetical protein
LKRLIEGDSDYWLHYGLPGGGGFVFFSGIVTVLLKRASGKKKRHNAAHAVPKHKP